MATKMANDRTANAQSKTKSRAEEWLKNAVKDKHVRQIPFSEITKVKYNVAKGGSGTIHLGAWRNMHVAIKEQHNTNDLIKELKMHKQVHDSNYIVKFFGITKHPLTQDTCIVMQFAENGCLQDYLETQNITITWLTKYRLAWEVASGLDFIHRENIFHTDLHSRNILIDTGGKALITDFGLSKSVNKTIYTTKAGLFGVVPYVAPERMQNPNITYTAKCDIYSLGVILWELSSCAIPFESQLQDVMLAVNIIAGCREKTVLGTAVEYEMLYRRCWDGLPQNRPQMDIVLSELVELLAAEQVSPRPAAPRPRSPRPPRPLSSGSIVAPSTVATHESDSPENSASVVGSASQQTLIRPTSVRQSIGQGMAPLSYHQDIPSVPIRQDRSGARVSILGEPLPTETPISNSPPHAANNYILNHSQGNGGSTQTHPRSPSPVKAGSSSSSTTATNNNKASRAPSQPQVGPTVDAPAQAQMNENAVSSNGATDNALTTPSVPSAVASAAPVAAPVAATTVEPPATTPTAQAGPTAAQSSSATDKQGPQYLPPIPTFSGLDLNSPPSADPPHPTMPRVGPPPVLDNSMNKLPETAALALANGISMASVLSKLKIARTISTISPPPPGAPPPPPNAVAGHSNSPRVISPAAGGRVGVISPPRMRNAQNPKPSKTISPPARMVGIPKPPPGAPPLPTPSPSPSASPSPSPNLGPIPKPPTTPAPSTFSPVAPPPGPPPTTSGAPSSRNHPAAPVTYVPTTTYTPKTKSPEITPAKSLTTAGTGADAGNVNVNANANTTANNANATLPETGRPTPARQIPMGFPVVTPLSPPHWVKRPTFLPGESNSTLTPSVSSVSSTSPATQSPASSEGSASAHSSPASSPTASPSATPSSGNDRSPKDIVPEPVSEAGAPSNTRRDFRPISFLTERKNPVVVDLAAIDNDARNYVKHSVDNAYVPNPKNSILPPSQLLLQRSNSPEFVRRDVRLSRLMDMNRSPSPSLSPRSSPSPSPSLSPSPSPGLVPRSNSPAPCQSVMNSAAIAMNRGGGGQGFFPVVEASWGRRDISNDFTRLSEDSLDVEPTKPTNVETHGSRPQLQPSKESSSSTATTGSTATLNSMGASSGTTPTTKPRVKLDNFYSLSDPYKDLQADEPTDFFTAVTQSDHVTVERMLKLFPRLIHESNGFFPHPTPILVAARSRRPLETIRLLHSYGAVLDRGDHNGMTVLHFICEQYPDPLEGIQYLCKAGADTNNRDGKKRTPLMMLLQNTKVVSTKVLIESIRVLFRHGAQVNAVDQPNQSQRTPLHYAIQYCKDPAPVMELLLKKGADVNARDWKKATPLHAILERMDDEEIVQMLLLYGADPSLTISKKRNALAIAAENLRVMSAWFLLENDLQSSAPDSVKRALELCSKANGPDKNSKPLFKNMLSDWTGKDGKVRRIQLAQDCILRVQRTPDMKTVDQTMYALEFLESCGVPIHGNGSASSSSISSHNNNNNNNNCSNSNLGSVNMNASNNNNNNNNTPHNQQKATGKASSSTPGQGDVLIINSLGALKNDVFGFR
ncbi:hypothetical protein BGZ94_003324 [Podila epigama]|nr:hypothetical protein BGZ94_003324 [Podila epigama]